MNNPDVYGNKASFEAVEGSTASFVSVQVAGVEINPGAPPSINYVKMPVMTVLQNLIPSFWLTVIFNTQTILTLTPGVWMVLASGVVLNTSTLTPNTLQVRITDPAQVNYYAQMVITIPIGAYYPFALTSIIDTDVTGLQLLLQINPSTDGTLFASNSPAQQFTPQFSAVELVPR